MIRAERDLCAVADNTNAKFAKLLEHFKTPDAVVSAVADAVVKRSPLFDAPGETIMKHMCGTCPLAARLHAIARATFHVNTMVTTWRKAGKALESKYPDDELLKTNSLATLLANGETSYLKIAEHVVGNYTPLDTAVQLNAYECSLILGMSMLVRREANGIAVLSADSPLLAELRRYSPQGLKIVPIPDTDQYEADFYAVLRAYMDMRSMLVESAEVLFAGAPVLKLY